MQLVLWEQPASSNCSHIPGKLSLCKGLPVLIRSNVATELCITKGQEGIVHSWIASPGLHGRLVLQTLFIQLINPPTTVNLPDLPTNVVPLVKSTVSITCSLPDNSEISVLRTQVEVLPNFAMTDYLSQGKTRQFNVCDLNNSRTHQAIYTALSRSSSASGTVILQGFDQSKITGGCLGALRQEYRELELLDNVTTLRYESKLSDTVYGDRWNTIIENFRKSMGTNFNPPGLHPSLSWSDKSPFEHCVVSFSWNHNFHCSNEPPGGSSGRADQVEENPDINRLKRKFVPLDQHELQLSARAPSIPHLISFMPCRPSWTNNSCAYDALTAVLYNIWQENPPFWHESFCSINSQFLAPLSHLMLTQSFSPALADRVRDELRSLMYNFDGSSYQPGQYVSAVDIAVHLFSTGRSVCTGSLFCANGHAGSESMRRQSYHSAFIQIILDDNPSSFYSRLDPRIENAHSTTLCRLPRTSVYCLFIYVPDSSSGLRGTSMHGH